MTDLTCYRRKLDSLSVDHGYAMQTVATEEERLRKAQEEWEAVGEAQQLAQEVAQRVQQVAHARLASIVSRCLRDVFGEDAYEFRIDFVKQRGKTEARLVFVRGGKEIDPVEGAGFGAVDVAAFALRLTALVMMRPALRKLLVLDEPARHLSAQYRPAFRQVVESLATEMGVQIIMVTHSKQLQIGKIIELEG